MAPQRCEVVLELVTSKVAEVVQAASLWYIVLATGESFLEATVFPPDDVFIPPDKGSLVNGVQSETCVFQNRLTVHHTGADSHVL